LACRRSICTHTAVMRRKEIVTIRRSIIGIMLISESSALLLPCLIASTFAPAICVPPCDSDTARLGIMGSRGEILLLGTFPRPRCRPAFVTEGPFAIPWSQRLRDVGGAEICTSALLHGALLFMFATAMASLDASEREAIEGSDKAAMRGYLRASTERADLESGDAPGQALSDGQPGLSDALAPLDRGRRSAPHAEGRGSGRHDLLSEAKNWGVIGLLP